jgi:hypothetical protein
MPPNLKFRGFDTDNFTADAPLRLFAEADDDSAVLGVSLAWRRIDVLNDPWRRVLLYDDGRHLDGNPADGLFSGVLQSGLPDGATIQFYLEATDANNKTTYLPESPEAAEDSGGNDLYVLAFGQSQVPVEITEVVSDNRGVYRDEARGMPDYVEIANVSGEPVSLDGYALIDAGLDPSRRFLFPTGIVLQPGQTLLVICDSNPAQGPIHRQVSSYIRVDARSDECDPVFRTCGLRKSARPGPAAERDQYLQTRMHRLELAQLVPVAAQRLTPHVAHAVHRFVRSE